VLNIRADPPFLATFNQEEGDLSEHFLDRVAISLSATAEKLNTEEHVCAVVNVKRETSVSTRLSSTRKDYSRK
jgi:Mg-chelatase subunit ChlI